MKCRPKGLLSFALALLLASSLSHAQDIPSSVPWESIPGSGSEYAVFAEGGAAHYAVRDSRGELLVHRTLDTRIRLRDGSFDPMTDEIPTPQSLLAARENGRLWIVQYRIPGVPQFQDGVIAAGGEVVGFLPHAASLVRMDASTHDQVQKLPYVRWVGRYHPGYRLDAETRAALLTGHLGTAKYNMLTTVAGGNEKAALAEVLTAAGGRADPIVPFGQLLSATLSASALLDVLHRDELLFLDPWGDLEPDLDIARIVGGADALESTAGYDGTGVVGEVMDTGVLVGHLNYNTPTFHGSNSTDTSHGTSVYGIVFGTGNHNPTARGILPAGTPLFAASSSFLGNFANRYPHTAQLTQPPYEAVFQTNSTGSPRTFFYTTISSDMDTILFDNDFVILQSQSNAGNQDSRPEAWAKNMISVGGVRHYNTATTADDAWLAGGSIGPAQDGRIKPDISMFYDNIRSTANTGTTGYTETFGGTSGATPLTAGHVGLLHQMYADGIFGNAVVPGAGVFANRPHMTTAKALLINTAAQYPFVGATSDLTRVHQGWGRPNVENAWNLRNRMIIVDESDVLLPFQATRRLIDVTATDPELRVTMIFADPAGNPAAAESRVNDLSLRVIAPDGTTYWGNNGLTANNYSTAGGSPNTVDNVEMVLINGPMTGTWTVDVIAFEVNQDSHVETPAIDADYALVISGAGLVPNGPASTGQANSANASLTMLGGFNNAGQSAAFGVNGPFTTALGPGIGVSLVFGGQANQSFLLLYSPTVTANNAVIPGVGSLDLGIPAAALSDVAIVLNGATPASFFDNLARLGPNGTQTLSFSLPASLSGSSFGGFQAAMLHGSGISLSAAFQLDIN